MQQGSLDPDSIQAVHACDAPSPIGPYSQATVANGFIFVSGQLPLKPGTTDLCSADIADQTEQCLRNITAILASAGVVTWWRTVGPKVAGLPNLSVVQIPHAPVQQLAQTVDRRASAQVMVMEGQVTMTVGDVDDITFTPEHWSERLSPRSRHVTLTPTRLVGAKLSLARRRTRVVPRQRSQGCHADVGGARSRLGRPFGLWHAARPGACSRELECFASFANDAGVALEQHSSDIGHARAVFEHDTHVLVAFDVGNFACPVSHTHDDVAAKAKVSQGYRVRESVLVDGAQYCPGRAAVEIRLNLFVTHFPWHATGYQARNQR